MMDDVKSAAHKHTHAELLKNKIWKIDREKDVQNRV